jgi:hypothetical protein
MGRANHGAPVTPLASQSVHEPGNWKRIMIEYDCTALGSTTVHCSMYYYYYYYYLTARVRRLHELVQFPKRPSRDVRAVHKRTRRRRVADKTARAQPGRMRRIPSLNKDASQEVCDDLLSRMCRVESPGVQQSEVVEDKANPQFQCYVMI